MPRRKRRLASRIRHCIRSLLAFLFSNVGVIVLVVAYTIAGAFMFQAIEGQSEMERVNNMERERDTTARHLYNNLTLVFNMFNDTILLERLGEELKLYQQKVVVAVRKGWDGSRSSRQWSFSSAFLYSLTVITTIGYGHLSPRTNWGKVMTIFYALLGMPLFLLYLANIGDLLARWCKCLYALVCLCRGCPGFTRRRMARHAQLELSDAESIERPEDWRHSDSDTTDRYPPKPTRFNQRRPDYLRSTSMPNPYENDRYKFLLEHRDPRIFDPRNPYFRGIEPNIGVIYHRDYRGAHKRHFGETEHVTFRRMERDRDARLYGRHHRDDIPLDPRCFYPTDPRILNSRVNPRVLDPRDVYCRDPRLDGRGRDPRVRGWSEPLGYRTESEPSDFSYVTFDAQTITVPISVCVGIMVGYLFFGSMIFGLWENWNQLDGAYFCFISLSSIGFGDFVPGERVYSARVEASFVVCSLYLTLGTAAVAMCFNLMQEQVIHYVAGIKRAVKRLCTCKR